MIENIKKQLLPIIFGTAIVSAILYIYNAKSIIIITILSFIAQALLFAFYNKIKSNGKNGAILYVAGLIVVLIIIYSLILISGKPINFIKWFFSTQSAKTRSTPYSFTCFISFNFLISSFIFYFTQVIYRSIFVFLVTIIPFAIYAKRYENISLFYIVLLLALYIAVMIHCRQMARVKTVTVVTDTSYKKSVSIFVFVTIAIAILIPKPIITPLRGNLEALFGGTGAGISASDKLGGFLSQSSGASSQTTNEILYRVEASEPLYFRRQTFDLYQGTNWTFDETYGNSGSAKWSDGCEELDYNKYIEIIKSVASSNPEFAQKYNIKGLPELKNNRKTAKVMPNNFNARYFLSTIYIRNITGFDSNPRIFSTLNGDLFIGNSDYLNPNDSYTVSYYSETTNKENQSILFAQNFDKFKYEAMLKDLNDIMLSRSDNNAVENCVRIYQYQSKEKDAYKYYNDTYQEPSEKIKALSQKITAGLYSDYDKAKALEQYFSENKYVYDLNYKPNKGNEGAEYFIFESKKGSCSSYATAMTLMARSIGLPARYVEGFLMDEKENSTTYLIRDADAHAFTEIFISGYGWMTFDATVSTHDKNKAVNKIHKLSENEILLIIIICSSVLALATIIILLMPKIKELIFRIRIKFKKNNPAMLFMYKHIKKRISKKLKIKTDMSTAKIIEYIIYQAYGIYIAEITESFEKVCYGEKELTDEELKAAYKIYLNFYKVSKTKSKNISVQ